MVLEEKTFYEYCYYISTLGCHIVFPSMCAAHLCEMQRRAHAHTAITIFIQFGWQRHLLFVDQSVSHWTKQKMTTSQSCEWERKKMFSALRMTAAKKKERWKCLRSLLPLCFTLHYYCIYFFCLSANKLWTHFHLIFKWNWREKTNSSQQCVSVYSKGECASFGTNWGDMKKSGVREIKENGNRKLPEFK